MSQHRDELWTRLCDLLAQHGPNVETMDDDEHDALLNGFIDGIESDVFPMVGLIAESEAERERQAAEIAGRTNEINDLISELEDVTADWRQERQEHAETVTRLIRERDRGFAQWEERVDRLRAESAATGTVIERVLNDHLPESAQESGCALRCGYDGDDLAAHLAAAVVSESPGAGEPT